jgi:hypothetical protein
MTSPVQSIPMRMACPPRKTFGQELRGSGAKHARSAPDALTAPGVRSTKVIPRDCSARPECRLLVEEAMVHWRA